MNHGLAMTTSNAPVRRGLFGLGEALEPSRRLGEHSLCQGGQNRAWFDVFSSPGNKACIASQS